MDAKGTHVVAGETERELRLQLDNLRNILEAVSDGIYIVNRDCDIEYVNPVIEREFGKVDGRKCYEYFHGLKEPCSWCKNEIVFNGGSVRWEWHSEKTGKTYDLFDTPIVNSDGTVSKFEIFHDITAFRQAEEALRESEERYREAFHSSKAVKLLIDPETGAIIDANSAASQFYGYSREQLISMLIHQINTLSREALTAEMEAAKNEHRNYFLFHHRLASGEIRDVEVYSSPVSIKGRKILHSIVHDITGRKEVEEKLKAAKEEAEAATLLKDKFVSLVAHDLKNPIGNSLLALKSFRARLKEQGVAIADDAMLALSISANENMLHLIEDLLEMSRIRSGAIRPRFAFTDAHYLVQYAVDGSANDAARKGITVANLVPPRSRLYCDMKLTGEVMVNLLSNAIKFSNKGGSITIGQKAGEPSALYIKDTGVGIQPDCLGSLFKYEVHTSTSGTEGERGTGMGLPLSNELMQSQGGTLAIESAPGHGTTVTVMLPHVTPKALVVEDSEFDMQIVRMFLKDLNIKVLETASGEEALRLMALELPHLVLLDINLPDISGFDVMRRKDNNPQISEIPVIVITGSVDPNLADEAFRLGAVDFIKKPIQPEILTARVRRLVS